jgi:hypothetical protein
MPDELLKSNTYLNQNKMKLSSNSVFLFLLSLSILSCRNNSLKTDEKALAREILNENKARPESSNTDSKFSKRGKDEPVTFRKKEIRSVDSQNPPVRIDIPGTVNNTRKFKLSDIASSIRYVKLQTPPDTLLLYDHFYYRPDLDSKIRSDDEQIIFEGLFGLTRFNMQGEYQETIWKNETGIKFAGSVVGWGGQDFFGVPFQSPVSLSNGNLYFTFDDRPSGTGLVMKYKSPDNKIISSQSRTETKGPGIVPGDTLFITSNQLYQSFDLIFGTSPDTWAGINNKWNAGTSGSLMVTYDNKGDTLCQFTDYDRIENFKHTTYRSHAVLTGFYYNGLLTIKQEYNDTIFRLVTPNQLLPVYIIDFGVFKVNYMDGLNPNFDLSGKYMLNSLNETNDFLLLRYTENNDSPNNRKKNAVKFYNALFSKKEGKLYHLPGGTVSPQGLENDLDGGISFWPEFITPQGEMMKLVSGKVIKDYVSSTEFKSAKITIENRQKQISMASGLKPTDMVVIIVN